MAHPSKTKGDKFERLIRDTIVEAEIPVDRIPAGASNDRGDLWIPGATVQCKNGARLDLAGWWRQTTAQRDHNRHDLGFLVHKRVGVTEGLRQWVTIDVETMIEILKGRAR